MGVVQSQAKDRPSSYSSRMSAESYLDAKSVRGTSLVCSWFLEGGASQVTCSKGSAPIDKGSLLLIAFISSILGYP